MLRSCAELHAEPGPTARSSGPLAAISSAFSAIMPSDWPTTPATSSASRGEPAQREGCGEAWWAWCGREEGLDREGQGRQRTWRVQ